MVCVASISLWGQWTPACHVVCDSILWHVKRARATKYSSQTHTLTLECPWIPFNNATSVTIWVSYQSRLCLCLWECFFVFVSCENKTVCFCNGFLGGGLFPPVKASLRNFFHRLKIHFCFVLGFFYLRNFFTNLANFLFTCFNWRTFFFPFHR